jgi:predicted nucleic acid-binding protein
VALLFLDTSALVKRYDTAEPGADRVAELCDRSPGQAVVLAALAPVEVASALSRKVRDGRFTLAERDERWAAFGSDLELQYQVIGWDEGIRMASQRLVFAHPIRAYDAVQVASALRLAQLLANLTEVTFCTSDRRQAQTAAVEGLHAELIG